MSAILSLCEMYRFRLERDLGRSSPLVAILGVNPSRADAVSNDQTIRKDIGFGEVHGWGRLIKGNKFAFRAQDVRELRRVHDPVGPENDAHLEQIMRDADVHVVAWGTLGKLPVPLRTRWRALVRIADRVGCRLMCFGTAADGHPLHTLMLGYATPLVPWQRPA